MSSETPFKLPLRLPSWPPGGNFAKGTLDFGGLEVTQISTFSKVWSTTQGGPGDAGATFYKPSLVPSGFALLGHYAQPNSKQLSGWVLVARDVSGTGTLSKPLDYALLYSDNNSTGANTGYFWFPIAPDGYRPVGVLVTTSIDKPSLDEVRCIRTDFVGECESDTWIWGNGTVDVYDLQPKDRDINATGVRAGSFIIGTPPTTVPPIASLKNAVFGNFNVVPNLDQIKALVRVYAPVFYFHPDEPYLPSSINWYFEKGALLYKKGDSTSSLVKPEGANLPQGGSNDGTFWLDLPTDGSQRDAILKGDVESAITYVHAKPMLGGTFTDLAMWLFYPFNGAARARLGAIKTIPLGKIGEHVGDWEHVTLRVSNLTGELWRVYLSQHSSGTWFDPPEMEREPGTNQPIAYSALHGHPNYAHPGLVLQGNEKLGIGIRNDTAKGGARLNAAQKFEVVAADHLESFASPPWVNYFREWGPKITYDIGKELDKVLKFIPGPISSEIRKIVNGLPAEVLGEEGPTGPKEKSSWAADEK